MSARILGSLVKAVVDIQREVMVIDAELYADEESYLLEEGSKQEHLWGINLYPDMFGEQSWIEFDSMINLRPGMGQSYPRSRKSRFTGKNTLYSSQTG